MSLASDMRNLSQVSASLDTEFKEVYDDFVKKIKARAEQGYREIRLDDNKLAYDFENPNRERLLDMLKQKLQDNGFNLVRGYEIGKPMGSSMSKFIVW